MHDVVARRKPEDVRGPLGLRDLSIDEVDGHPLVDRRERGQKTELHSTAHVYPALMAPSNTIVAAVM